MSPICRRAAIAFSVLLALTLAACGETKSTSLSGIIEVRTPAGNRLDEIAFRNTPIGGHDDQVFLIRSAAAVPLHVSAITFEAADGKSADAFSALTAFPLGLDSMTEERVTLRFAPGEVRRYPATAVIHSDDRDKPALRIPLVGEGVAGRLEVIACLPNTATEDRRCADSRVSPPDPLHLGEVTAGAHEAALITLQNGGGDVLDVERIAFVDAAAAAAAGFTLPDNAGAGMLIPPLESANFTVHFNPPADPLGPVATIIRIESDSTTAPVIDVELQAEVVPNTAPEACVYVREIRHVDGSTESFAPGAGLPAVEPADVVVFDALAGEGCSGDAEDGEEITAEWTLTTPHGLGALKSVQGEPLQRSLEVEATGDYRVDLLVRDSLGLEATADAAGNPATVSLRAVPRRDVAVEVGWADDPLVDVDLHFVRGNADDLWNPLHDTYWDNPSPNWGDPLDSFDDPALLFDDLGGGSLVETAILNHPEPGQSYWIYARFNKDDRQRTTAANCSADAECGALVCSSGKCMEPVDVSLKVFLQSEAFDLSVLAGFDNPVQLKTPCDTWLAGRVSWPAAGSPAAPTFEMADTVFPDGTPRGAVCDLQ